MYFFMEFPLKIDLYLHNSPLLLTLLTSDDFLLALLHIPGEPLTQILPFVEMDGGI